MTREECQEKLMDLLYGELDEPEAEQVRAALRTYPDVEQSWNRLQMAQQLSMHLPMPEPAPSVDQRIMAAARAKVSGEEPASVVRAAADAEEEGVWASILRWVGGFAMGPQVAMATIMMLVVAIGLWYLPGSESPEQQASGGTVVRPPDEGEVAPSSIEPAEPLVLDLDRRAGRITARDDEQAQTEGAAAATPGLARSQRAAQRSRTQAGGDVIERNLDGMLNQGLGGTAAPTPTSPASRGAPIAAPADEDEAALGTASREVYDRGITRYQRGDFRGAAEDLNQIVLRPDSQSRQLVPDALYTLARSHQRAGNCGTAIPHYQSLLRRFPAYGQAPHAMLRLAECYRRMGRVSEARTTLERARAHGSVAAEAQRELIRLDQMDRALRRPARRIMEEAPSAADFAAESD